MKKKVLKNIFGSFFAFVTALFLLAAAVFAAGYITTTEQHIYYCTDKSRYCENSAKLIENDLNDITVPSGLPEGFFTGKGDAAELEKINRDCIAKNYSGKEFTADTAKIEADLVKYFTDFASQNELQMGDEIDTEAIADLAKTCSESYTDFGANLVFEYLSLYSGKFNKYLLYGLLAALVLAAAGIFAITRFGGFTKNKFMYFALTGGGIMTVAFPLYILISNTVGKLNITPYTALDFIKCFANDFLFILIGLGVIMILVYIIPFIISSAKNKTGKH